MKKLLVAVTVVSAAWMLGASEHCVWIDERKALAREPFCMVRINETARFRPDDMKEVLRINAARPGSVDGYWFDLPMGLTRARRN